MDKIQKLKQEKQYEQYVKEKTPRHNLFLNMCKAFFLGGLICLLGQVIYHYFELRNLSPDECSRWMSLSLILLSVLFTGTGIYQKLAAWGGAGALVPITGFANSVAAPAIEYKKEGQVFGIGCKIFTIAGPVILYGIFTSWGLETSRSVSLERLNEILHALAHTEKYGTVLRAKGMLPDENGVWHYFDMVPEETAVREGAPIYTGKVCVIGSGLKEDDLKELFH